MRKNTRSASSVLTGDNETYMYVIANNVYHNGISLRTDFIDLFLGLVVVFPIRPCTQLVFLFVPIFQVC